MRKHKSSKRSRAAKLGWRRRRGKSVKRRIHRRSRHSRTHRKGSGMETQLQLLAKLEKVIRKAYKQGMISRVEKSRINKSIKNSRYLERKFKKSSRRLAKYYSKKRAKHRVKHRVKARNYFVFKPKHKLSRRELLATRKVLKRWISGRKFRRKARN